LFSIFLIGLLSGSFSYTLYTFFQKQQQLHYTITAYAQKNMTFNGSNQSSANKLSNALLEQFKTKVLKQLSSNSSDKTSISNSSFPISIVVGVVTPNGNQVSGFCNI
jgi:D-alanyl-D-alanine-carboxypeptidase/D-alanyl-D-alanine-endopeptidase